MSMYDKTHCGIVKWLAPTNKNKWKNKIKNKRKFKKGVSWMHRIYADIDISLSLHRHKVSDT